MVDTEISPLIVSCRRGGAGYVGAVLVPKRSEAGYKVTVLDLYMYGEDVLKEAAATCARSRATSATARWSSRRSRMRFRHPSCLHLERSLLRAQPRTRAVDQPRLLRAPGARLQERRRQALRLRVFVLGLRRQGRCRGDRGFVPRAAHRLFQVQGRMRGPARQGKGTRLHHGDDQAGHGLRLFAEAEAHVVVNS